MCTLEHHLKLCTCSDIDKSDSSWTLKRFKEDDWMDLESGRCLFPDYNDENIIIGEDILRQLDNNFFDFKYVPEEDDTLDIVISISGKKIPYEFIYKNHQWKIEGSISAHLNKKNIIKKGILQ